MIRNNLYPRALYIFNDNIADRYTGIAGANNAVARQYGAFANNAFGVHAAGVCTGRSSAEGGYACDDDDVARAQLACDLDDIEQLLFASNRYDAMIVPIDPLSGRLRTSRFHVDDGIAQMIVRELLAIADADGGTAPAPRAGASAAGIGGRDRDALADERDGAIAQPLSCGDGASPAARVSVRTLARFRRTEYEANRAFFANKSLPYIERAVGPKPAWLRRIADLRIRVTDFYTDGNVPPRPNCATTSRIVSYGAWAGATLKADHAAIQIGHSCGVVCARGGVDMANAGHRWFDVPLERCVERQWILQANEVLASSRPLNNDGTRFIYETEVKTLAQHWRLVENIENLSAEAPGPPCARCGEQHASADCPHRPARLPDVFASVTTCDYGLREIMTDLERVADTGEAIELPIIRALNTDDSRTSGSHWFAVAYTARRAVLDDDD